MSPPSKIDRIGWRFLAALRASEYFCKTSGALILECAVALLPGRLAIPFFITSNYDNARARAIGRNSNYRHANPPRSTPASHISFSATLTRPREVGPDELQGDIGAPKLSLGGAYGGNAPPICRLARDETEITFSVSRLRRTGTYGKWRLSTQAGIAGPLPDKGRGSALARRNGRRTLLGVRKSSAGTLIGRRRQTPCGTGSRRFRIDQVLSDPRCLLGTAPGGRPRRGGRRRGCGRWL